MKTLFIVLGIIYLVVALLAFIIQALMGSGDQSSMAWGMILSNSLGWPVALIRLIVR